MAGGTGPLTYNPLTRLGAPSGALHKRSLAFAGLGDDVTVRADDVMNPAPASVHDIYNKTMGDSPGCLDPFPLTMGTSLGAGGEQA